MLFKTAGIALRNVKYSESSIIVNIYTELFGIQTYMVNGARKPKAKISYGMLQPLSLLDLVVYHKANANMQRIAELKMSHIFQQIHTTPAKIASAQFLTEIIQSTVQEVESNPDFFHFLKSSIEELETIAEAHCGLFLLRFLALNALYSGFLPHLEKVEGTYFDFHEGTFVDFPLRMDLVADKALSAFLKEVFVGNTDQYYVHPLTGKAIEALLHFYRVQQPGFKTPKSFDMLKTMVPFLY